MDALIGPSSQATTELIAVCTLLLPPVLFGYATTIIPRIYTYYVSTALFAIFGVRMLREGLRMSPDEGQEELEEVQAEIKKKDEEVNHTSRHPRAQEQQVEVEGRHLAGR